MQKYLVHVLVYSAWACTTISCEKNHNKILLKYEIVVHHLLSLNIFCTENYIQYHDQQDFPIDEYQIIV